MPDVADMASRQEQLVIQTALSKHQANQANKAHGTVSRSTCEYCGKSIPKARQEAIVGVRLCVTCQQEEEEHDTAWHS